MAQESLGKKKGVADIVFLLDITGSMKPCLDALKENVSVLINSMTNPGANESAPVKDWRIKICGYRDYSADSDAWWIDHPFTSDPDQVHSDLASLEADGGGDEPESMLDGLWMLASLPVTEPDAAPDPASWRHQHDAARCVIVFTDASTHMATSIPDAGGAKFEDVARKVMEARLRLSIYAPEHECYENIAQIDKCEIMRVGTLSDAQEAMKTFTRDSSNFKKTMEQLAKSISVSAETPSL